MNGIQDAVISQNATALSRNPDSGVLAFNVYIRWMEKYQILPQYSLKHKEDEIKHPGLLPSPWKSTGSF